MKSQGLLLVFACCYGVLPFILAADEPSLVIEIFRHGARFGKNYPEFNSNFGIKSGELTEIGMHQQFLLGQALKTQYPSLLQSFDPNKILVRSSDYNRTLMSAYSQIYGIFEGTGNSFSSDYNLDLGLPPLDIGDIDNTFRQVLPSNFMPIPIQTVELPDDALLQPGGPVCPYAEELLQAQLKKSKPNEIAELFNSTLITLGGMFNMTNFSYDDALHLWDDVIAAYTNQITIPGDIDPYSDLGKNLSFIYDYLATYAGYGSDEQLKLQSVNLLTDIISKLESKANNQSTLEFVFYSSHDITLLPILGLFEVVTLDCIFRNFFNNTDEPFCTQPRFASHIQIELYPNTNVSESVVKFSYNDRYFNICKTESESCTLDEFRNLTNQKLGDFTVETYNQKCNRSNNPHMITIEQQVSSSLKAGVIILGVLAGVFVIAIVGTLIKQKKILKIPYNQVHTEV